MFDLKINSITRTVYCCEVFMFFGNLAIMIKRHTKQWSSSFTKFSRTVDSDKFFNVVLSVLHNWLFWIFVVAGYFVIMTNGHHPSLSYCNVKFCSIVNSCKFFLMWCGFCLTNDCYGFFWLLANQLSWPINTANNNPPSNFV